jgi:phage-related baseplate assembly protein
MPSSSLPDPSFIDRDAPTVTQDMVSMYEAMTGKTLYPAQPERLVIDVIAYREMLLRIAIQEAAKLNLVAYATAPMLDYLGQLVRVYRLPATAAQCTVQIVMSSAQTQDVVVPAGANLLAKDGSSFPLQSAVLLPAGTTTAIGTAVAETTGAQSNGFLPGEILGPDGTLWPSVVASATNLSTSFGGADAESDTRLRARILLGPEGFAVGGPQAAYEALVLAVHQDIVDVGISSAWPGLVNIYPLCTYGQPVQGILDMVTAALTSTSVRPLTDQVVVLPPTHVPFEIQASVTVCAWADEVSTLSAAKSALTDYTDTLRQSLGKQIIPSKLITLIGQVNGVYDVDLQSPSAMTLAANQWADCTSINLTMAGYGSAD